jgi:hypothetical protein
MPSIIQRSFAGGEVSPAVYGRAEQVKYATGARTLLNFIVQRFGGATNRPGTEYMREAVGSTSGKYTKLRRFVYSDAQTVMLEFGDATLRFIKDGVPVTVSGLTAWSNATSYAVGDLSSYGGVNYYCKIANTNARPDLNPFKWYAMPSDGTLEVPTTIVHDDVMRLQFIQSADVLTIVHPDYPPQQLKRYSSTKWVLEDIAFVPTNAAPTACQSTIGTAGTFTFKYRITAVKPDTFEESRAGLAPTKAITAATKANPCQVTAVGHGFVTGDEVQIDGINGMTELNGLQFLITKIDADNFTLDGINSTGYTTYTSGGTAARTYARIDLAAIPSQTAPNIISWTAASGALEYNVYKESNGVYGYIGTAKGTSFSDINYLPSVSDRLPTIAAVFDAIGDYPQTTAYFQQRHAFAGTNNDPEEIQLSRVGVYNDFSSSSPLQDDDAVGFSINGESVAEVRHLIYMTKPVVFTAGSVWTLDGDQDGVIRPTAIGANILDNHGSNYVRPIVIGNTALYISARGCIIREIAFDAVEGKKGRDLTVFANHLVDGHTIVAWAYQEVPHSVIWCVRDDGVLLGLTYVKEHEVWGWFRCTTDGLFLDVETIPEGEEDAVYVVVQRTINGTNRRYVERFASRRIEDMATDAFFVDSGKIYDGRNVTATTLTIGGGTTWVYTEALTLTASSSIFSAGDVGKDYILTIGGDSLRVHVKSYTSTTVVGIEPERDVPAAFRNVATASWSKCASVLTGLSHLEGKSVSIFADESVVTNGYDAPLIAVSGGSITVPTPVAYACVGLPYTSDIETLDWETPQQETLYDKQKLVQAVSLYVQDTRGGWAGAPAKPDDGTAGWLNKYMSEVKQRATEDYGEPTAITTGVFNLQVQSTWSERGRVLIRQRDPLPMTILAVIPRGRIGG